MIRAMLEKRAIALDRISEVAWCSEIVIIWIINPHNKRAKRSRLTMGRGIIRSIVNEK